MRLPLRFPIRPNLQSDAVLMVDGIDAGVRTKIASVRARSGAQRGRNRARVFACEADFQHHPGNLRFCTRELTLEVCARCLMTSLIELLIGPDDVRVVVGEQRLAGCGRGKQLRARS